MQESRDEAKQQIVDRIKQSTNILITVSNNPSVDALSAAIALSLMLNKLDKHATAVFSGSLPPAIMFLEPDKTFEDNVDSLRDFIIALDKEKADRLRYKVEDDVVKVFITPYRTTITEKDLRFSQGDFNVDMIIALGVEKREELDLAITAHGRILHDATVVTINAASQKSTLGSIDWRDSQVSSLCEMLSSVGDTLKPNIIDQQIGTALLTGIVSATERFSNQHTTPSVMTAAAKLMALGANQQLIATNLQHRNSGAPVAQSSSLKVEKAPVASNAAKGEMQIKHLAGPEASNQEMVLANQLAAALPAASKFDDIKQSIQDATDQAEKLDRPQNNQPRDNTDGQTERRGRRRRGGRDRNQDGAENYSNDSSSWRGREIDPPVMGGTLSATAEQALETKMQEEQSDRNRTILSHGSQRPKSTDFGLSNKQELVLAPLAAATEVASEFPAVEPAVVVPEVSSELLPELQYEPTISQLQSAKKAGNIDLARNAVDSALAEQPFDPANQPEQSVGAQPLPDVQSSTNDFDHLNVEPVEQQIQPEFSQPQTMPGSVLPPVMPNDGMPPMPDFNDLPPEIQLPDMSTLPELPVQPAVATNPVANDPGQFKIPGAL